VPKQTLKIQDFSGGLNTLQDPRDIPPNGASDLDSVKVDDPGRIRLSGGPADVGDGTGYSADHDQDGSAFNSEMQFLARVKPGTGLFQFGADKKIVQAVDTLYSSKSIQNTTSGTAPPVADTHVTLLHRGWDNSSTALSKTSIYDHNTDLWALDAVDLSASPATDDLSEPMYYNADGAIRIQEGNLNLGSTQRILQYIKRDHFKGASGASTNFNEFDGWFINKQSISYNPHIESGTVQPTSFDSHTTTDNTALSNAVEKVHVIVAQDTDETAIGWYGTGLAWQGAMSYVYDDGQESPLLIDTTTWSIAEEKKVKFKLRVCSSESTTIYMNPRLKGIKYYIKQNTSSDVKSTSWMLAAVFEFSGSKGGRRAQDTTWNQWTYDSGAGGTIKCWHAETDYFGAPPLVKTFRTETGRAPDEATDAHYKCAVVANRRVYIGNVTHAGLVGDTQQRYPDRMLKSGLAGGIMMHDVFPGKGQLDLAINDGDEIIELAHFMGKILQFKKRAVYVINVAGAQEYLESTHQYIGVSHKSQVITTASGIGWACKKGLMLYNGQSITNLIDGRLSVDDWQAFYSDGNNVTLGYDSNDAKVLIAKGAQKAAGDDMYIFDMKLKCFIFKSHGIARVEGVEDSYISNMLTDFNGDVIWYNAVDADADWATEEGSRMRGWDRLPQASSSFAYVTKDIDFGEPSTDKKIYKIYVTFRADVIGSTNVTAQYITDGEGLVMANLKEFKAPYNGVVAQGNQEGAVTAELLTTASNKWEIAELKPATATELSSVKSIRLVFRASGKALTGTITTAGTGYGTSQTIENVVNGNHAKFTFTSGSGGSDGTITGATITKGGKNWTPGSVIPVVGGNNDARYTIDTVETTKPDFEINDITIVFRPKRVK
jgi:hypothetical protein